jgi:rhodanese-related sulfurtransferase
MHAVTAENLARLSPLSGLGAESLSQVLLLANEVSFPRGTQPMDFQWDRKVVYLLKGEIKIDYPGGRVKVLVGGHAEALLPMGRSGMNPIHARPITALHLVWFDENALDILVTWDQLVPPASTKPADAAGTSDWRTMSGLFDARKLTQGTFSCLPAAHIDSLLACFQRQVVKAGETIVRQGEPGDFYYVIERGRASVTREVAGSRMDLAELKAGDAFGEEALIAETSRNATVTMKTDGELLRLDGADFVRLLREPLLQRVDPGEAIRRVAAGALWLDVRFPAEYRHDGFPDALNIPLNELRDALPTMNRDIEYVVYCQTGRRSSAAAFLLSQRGLRATLLEGGLKSMNPMENKAA